MIWWLACVRSGDVSIGESENGEHRSSGVLQSRYGQFKVTAYQDTIHQRVHLALTVGDIRADHPTLVRVHVTAVFRDLIGTTIEGHASWSFDASLRAIAEADAGVLVLLSKPETPRI